MSKEKKIAIVGSPNVGKSSIFNNLSGRYATVSNYPGTTVELFNSHIHIKNYQCQLIDTPGMYSFLPLSEEEAIARRILLDDKPDVVIHVAAAKDLDRSLPLTLQLIEASLNVILVVNIMDEASKQGMVIDIDKLRSSLGIAVIPTVSIRGSGIKELKGEILRALEKKDTLKAAGSLNLDYPLIIKDEIDSLTKALSKNYRLSKKLISTLLLQSDPEIKKIVKRKEESKDFEKINNLIEEAKEKSAQPIEYIINMALKEKSTQVISQAVKEKKKSKSSTANFFEMLTLKPIFAIPLLILFLYFGIYKLVGEFGSGTCVDFLESVVFEGYINPFFIAIFDKLTNIELIKSLFVGEYGIITLGFRYAVAIVLPIVGIFFFVFSFAEDTGYLPRVGAMMDRLFKKIGLSGRAVIPMVLGLGCDTMATMVVRILPSKRERIIATFLLSLSIPCSAQLGVIMSVLSKRGHVVFIWFFTIMIVFSFTGFLLNKVLKGRRPSFNIELPPLRLPRMNNIFRKTYIRLKWYFKEVLPLFIWASILIWVGQLTKIFDLIVSGLNLPLKVIGLPKDLSDVFLFGFFRRDYGAAGLYDLEKQGLLTTREILVAAVVLTLFLPCIAQLLINIKERGIKMAITISAFILVFSFSVGFVLNKVLLVAGMQ